MTRNKENKRKRIRRRHFFQGMIAITFLFSLVSLFTAPSNVTSQEQTPIAEVEVSPTPPIPGAIEVKVPIFVYHSVRPFIPGESEYQNLYDTTPDLLRQQLQYLKDNGYTTITFEDLSNALQDGKALPEKPVILSFDDGWENEFVNAFPLLKEFNDVGTFYLFTNAIEIKHYMSWDDVLALSNAGMEIGGHSKSHPVLTNILDINTLRDEIEGGKKILQEHLGKAVTTFAYPFGSYDDRVEAIVREAGFQSARTLKKGFTQNNKSLYTLNAYLASDKLSDFINVLNKAK